ncbi:MAG: HEPN domain-containing protein [Lachnospiraceae bacterium]|nr:HEPN domain-containing protein [Lachnospiraceae bacterium]
MTKEQKLYKMLIKADLKIVENNWNSVDKFDRLQAAFHMQQAIEKTIKLKADVKGLPDLWGHNLVSLMEKCDENRIDIDVPEYIKEKADVITLWEADGRYYPQKMVRRDAIKKAYDITVEWLESGDTRDRARKKKA